MASGLQAHGAEILCSKYSNASAAASSENEDAPLATDPRWLRFLAALSDKGYFKVSLTCHYSSLSWSHFICTCVAVNHSCAPAAVVYCSC